MDYKLKILREDNLSKFLLNPFDRSAYIDDKIIQKYPLSESVDDIICLSNMEEDFCRVGAVIYKNNEIIIGFSSSFGLGIVNEKPFILIDNLKNTTKELVRKMLDKLKVDRLEEIRDMALYQKLYTYRTSRYLSPFVFTELGTGPITLDHGYQVNNKIAEFVNGLRLDDFIEISLGSMEVINDFLDKFITSEIFLEVEMVDPQIVRDAKDYVAAGKFNKREQILIDYLYNVKRSKACTFTVETTGGRSAICNNFINYYGKVFSTDMFSFVADVEDIEKITCNGSLIYKKSI